MVITSRKEESPVGSIIIKMARKTMSCHTWSETYVRYGMSHGFWVYDSMRHSKPICNVFFLKKLSTLCSLTSHKSITIIDLEK